MKGPTLSGRQRKGDQDGSDAKHRRHTAAIERHAENDRCKGDGEILRKRNPCGLKAVLLRRKHCKRQNGAADRQHARAKAEQGDEAGKGWYGRRKDEQDQKGCQQKTEADQAGDEGIAAFSQQEI